MEEQNLNSIPSYVGPLGKAEDSADCFISGLVYCTLLEQLLEKQRILDIALASNPCARVLQENSDLEKVWLCLGETFAIEC
jgi:hypothetical protein